MNVNQASCVRDANKRIVFQGTAVHLLADTAGTTFRLPALQTLDGSIHDGLLLTLLERKLNADLFNASHQTGRSIAQTVTDSPFLKVLERLNLYRKLDSELPPGRGRFSGTSV